MGQQIEVAARIVGDIAVFDTDRSVTGQDGVVYTSSEEARGDARFPGKLAQRIFEADPGVDHVFVGSNVVVVRRPAGWDDPTVSAVSDTVSSFFLYYPG